MEVFLAFIALWAPNFNPRGWEFCAGQLIAIAQNTALFSLIGTAYGGDGRVTFALPDFRGRVPVGAGQSPGTGNYQLGEKSGTEDQSLTNNNLPPHTHSVAGVSVTVKVSSANGVEATPTNGASLGGVVASRVSGLSIYNNENPDVTLNNSSAAVSGEVGVTGVGNPFSVVQPFQVVNYIIATQGIFPSRN